LTDETTGTPAQVPEPAETAVYANYVDGTDAVMHRVSLELSRTHLNIILPDGERVYWPLDALRALRDQAHSGGIVLTEGFDNMARLVVDNPYVAADLRSAAPNLDQRQPVTNWGRITAWAGGAVASVALIIFVLVPIMADQLATYLPPDGERALGDATFEQIRGALGRANSPVRLCEEADGLAAVDAMMARLDPSDDLPYEVRVAVLDHELVNAFALPGGRVILFRGLIDEAQNPEEVASILAHEIGHVVNRDPTRDALRSAGSIGVLGLIFGDFAGGTVVLMLANQLINAKYSQAAEAGADDYAHQLMREAGVDPRALGTFFGRLMDEYGDAEGIMAHFASHPQMVSRIEAAQQASEGGNYGLPVITPAQWRAMQTMCGQDAPDPAEDADADDARGGRLGGRN
jgi:hypothetical protein